MTSLCSVLDEVETIQTVQAPSWPVLDPEDCCVQSWMRWIA